MSNFKFYYFPPYWTGILIDNELWIDLPSKSNKTISGIVHIRTRQEADIEEFLVYTKKMEVTFSVFMDEVGEEEIETIFGYL